MTPAELSPDARSVVEHGVRIRTLEDRTKTVEDKLDRIQWTAFVGSLAAVGTLVAAIGNLLFRLK